MHVVVISGMSGGGKSEALRALEDVGFFCVDNLPIPLLGRFVDLLGQAEEATRVAIVIDIRGGEFLSGCRKAFQEIRSIDHTLEIVFLDAEDEVLVRRFSETRRLHPLHSEDLRSGLVTERGMLAELRSEADQVIETSGLTVHELRRRLRQQYATRDAHLRVSVLSFGYKYGVPSEADIVFDVRFLRNPYFVDDLRPLSGVDSRVADFVLQQTELASFMEQLTGLLEYLLPLYRREGKAYLTVAVGCTGGRHRSVAVAEELRKKLSNKHPRVAVRHRDMERS
ncbi:MAG: RNase adapter RapZ [bacterium]